MQGTSPCRLTGRTPSSYYWVDLMEEYENLDGEATNKMLSIKLVRSAFGLTLSESRDLIEARYKQIKIDNEIPK